ncbi:MAG TPA: cytidylate kinase-like family protein [Actinomycetota bacterium]|nr:cytidylate kinase-like family protein [Actinomycetota bacterium]
MSVPDPSPGPARPVVTLAAFYGAGGTLVGPRVAERLRVVFLDRGILTAVAKRLRVPEEAAAEYEEPPHGGVGRFLDSLGKVGISDGTPMDNLAQEEHRYRAETEEFIAAAAESGGVILGRGGQVILRGRPGVLHVLLGGPREARIRQGMEIEGIDQKTAGRRQQANDRARIEYVRRSYGVDPLDPDLYHLVLDSPALGLDTCVDLVVAASEARIRQARPAGHD